MWFSGVRVIFELSLTCLNTIFCKKTFHYARGTIIQYARHIIHTTATYIDGSNFACFYKCSTFIYFKGFFAFQSAFFATFYNNM